MRFQQAVSPVPWPQRLPVPLLPGHHGGTDWLIGECWRCDQPGVPVMWIGPAQTDGISAPFYACEPCVQRITSRIHAYHHFRDNPTYRAS